MYGFFLNDQMQFDICTIPILYMSSLNYWISFVLQFWFLTINDIQIKASGSGKHNCNKFMKYTRSFFFGEYHSVWCRIPRLVPMVLGIIPYWSSWLRTWCHWMAWFANITTSALLSTTNISQRLCHSTCPHWFTWWVSTLD